MNGDLLLVVIVLTGTLVMFIWSKLRYDLVALLALLIIGIGDIIPAEQIFTGLGHPAVITVVGVLVVSRALLNAGIVDYIANLILKKGKGTFSQIASLTGISALSSSFMNNVGALSLFMPVTLSITKKSENPASIYLMPLAFGSILGGLFTLIGTPPNIIIATFRTQTEAGEPFRMFDFLPVGGPIVFIGVLFIILIGWRLLPRREGETSSEDMMGITNYLTELEIPEDSKLAGGCISDLEIEEGEEITIVDLIRRGKNYPVPDWSQTLKEGDILVIKADTEELKSFIDSNDLKMAESKDIDEARLSSRDVELLEVVVQPDSFLEGKTASSLSLRTRYGINLLGVAREDQDLRARLKNVIIKSGDVLLLQGKRETLYDIIPRMGCLPLAKRELQLEKPRKILEALTIFLLAIISAATGIIPVQISFLGAAVIYILTGFVSLEEAYDSIDWPVIVLLGSMFPLSKALEVTGGSQMIASIILNVAQDMAAWLALGIVFTGTMLLSNIINNAAATVLMAPIATSIAQGMGISADAFLMGVAVSASCAFLTPIGHQNNTLVMGPGGYKFSDFWKMGLPLSIIVVITAVPLLLWIWA
ncbi:MAG: SLC13 family permease [Bacillota bacterium]